MMHYLILATAKSSFVAERKLPSNWGMTPLLKSVLSKCCGGQIDVKEERITKGSGAGQGGLSGVKDQKDDKETINKAETGNKDSSNSDDGVNNKVDIDSAGANIEISST
jgi:hypothetical protein